MTSEGHCQRWLGPCLPWVDKAKTEIKTKYETLTLVSGFKSAEKRDLMEVEMAMLEFPVVVSHHYHNQSTQEDPEIVDRTPVKFQLSSQRDVP